MVAELEGDSDMNPYALLGVAILAEVVGTVSLKFSQGFSRPLPAIGVLVGYGVSFYLLSLTLEELPVGLIYATWSALGIICIAAVGIVLFDEQIDVAGVAGIVLIVTGVYVLNIISEMSAH